MKDLYLKEFAFTKECRGIKPFTIKFKKPLTVIVGENGSGKSTLLSALVDEQFNVKIDFKPGVPVKTFDTEKQNPRLKSYVTSPIDMLSRFASHGEAMLPIMTGVTEFENEILLIDEPEAGISLKNQQKIWTAFNAAIKL